MKLWHWALIAVAAYEVVGGFLYLSASSLQIPTVGSLVESAASGAIPANVVAGADIAIGAAIFWFPLHHRLS